MLNATTTGVQWGFDISSLMVLISEADEYRYRFSNRSLLQAVAAAPVVGLQTYLRSYDMLLEPASTQYLSRSGYEAPLQNMELENAIRQDGLLADGQYNVRRVRVVSQEGEGAERPKAAWRRWRDRLHPTTRRPDGTGWPPRGRSIRWNRRSVFLWVAATWVYFGLLMVFLVLVPLQTTWIGFASCAAMTGWSIILRVIECVRLERKPATKMTRGHTEDAVFFLGRNNSAFVLRGLRLDIKNWTSTCLTYKEYTYAPAAVVQAATRFGSLVMLLFVFVVLPNGSTMDQLAFVLLNLAGQLNTVLGLKQNRDTCLAKLDAVPDETAAEGVGSRTEIYARLLRQHRIPEGGDDWVEAVSLLPKTKVWKKWAQEILTSDEDAKKLYDRLDRGEDEDTASDAEERKSHVGSTSSKAQYVVQDIGDMA